MAVLAVAGALAASHSAAAPTAASAAPPPSVPVAPSAASGSGIHAIVRPTSLPPTVIGKAPSATSSAPDSALDTLADKLNAALAAVHERQAQGAKAAPGAAASAPQHPRRPPARRAAAPAAHRDPGSWSYAGDTGPDHWAALSADNAACSRGERQSPIDIHDADLIRVNLDPIAFHYQASAFSVIDSGHTIRVLPGTGNSLDIMGRRFELVEFQFHHPSETRIDGKAYALEIELIHRDAQGRTAIVSLLGQLGAPQPVVQRVWDNLPLERHDVVLAAKPLNLQDLLPASPDYYTFMGSLTTPPCTGDVLWMVMKQPITLSQDQLDILERLYPANARPVQALGGRLIKASK